MQVLLHPSQTCLRELFDYEHGQLIRKVSTSNGVKVGDLAGTRRPDGYWLVGVDGKRYYRHRLIWIWHHGEIPEGLHVDHINQVPGDDRVQNLQLLTSAEHTRKTKADNKTNGLPTGVYFNKSRAHLPKPYEATIRNGGKKRGLGCFATAEEASAAYQEALLHPRTPWGSIHTTQPPR